MLVDYARAYPGGFCLKCSLLALPKNNRQYKKRVVVQNKLNLLLKCFCTTHEHYNYLQLIKLIKMESIYNW